MPNKITHSALTIAEATAFSQWYIFTENVNLLIISCGIILTLLVNPDLDVRRRKPNNFFKKIWWYYWYPYSHLSHRSFFSHFPVISTVIRALYFPVFLLYLTGFPVEYLILGMVISDFVHYIADVVVTHIKKKI